MRLKLDSLLWYDRLELSAPKGEKLIQQAAKQVGQSGNVYVYEAVCRRMEQGSTETDTPGVVKNLEGDTDPVEWGRCSISPDQIEYEI